MTDLDQTKVKMLQNYEYKLQQLLMQKQQMQSNLLEIDNALKELSNKSEAYEIVGSVMIKKSATDLVKNLDEKKALIEIKINAIDKQEIMIKDKADQLQKELVDSTNKK